MTAYILVHYNSHHTQKYMEMPHTYEVYDVNVGALFHFE